MALDSWLIRKYAYQLFVCSLSAHERICVTPSILALSSLSAGLIKKKRTPRCHTYPAPVQIEERVSV